MDNIAFDYLDPIQQAQLAHLRPDVYNRIKEEQREAQMDEQRLEEKVGDKEC